MAVIDNTFETQGTHLFFVDTTGSSDVIVKLTCPTGISGVAGGARDQIDTTCLDVTDGYRKFVGGLATGDTLSVPFVLYKDDAGHQVLFELKQSAANIGWLVGLSDSTAAPTAIDSDGNLEPPATRTCFTFFGYVSNVTIDANTNEVVRGTLTIQPNGATTAHWAA